MSVTVNANGCDFRPNIRQAAAALDREPTPEQVEHLNLTMQSLAIVDPETKAVSMPADDDSVVDIAAYLDLAAARFARAPETVKHPARADGMVKFQVGHAVSYRRPDDPLARIANSFRAADAARTAKEVAGWMNPWQKGQENRTRQQVIINTNPALAKRFKAEAGV